ncbi:MAG: hypothetical protein ACR2KV_17325 [Solirubrobacteraceae bacterium]
MATGGCFVRRVVRRRSMCILPLAGTLILIATTAAGATGRAAAAGSAHGARTAKKTRVIYVQDAGVVAPYMTADSNERCPTTAPHAVAGFFGSNTSTASGQLGEAASRPYGAGDRHWSIGVKNLGAQPQSYFVGVVCVSSARSFVHVSTTGTIDPLGTNGNDMRCPARAPYPVAGTFGPQGGPDGRFLLAESVPDRRVWIMAFRNITNIPQAYTVGVICARSGLEVDYLSTAQITVAPTATAFDGGRCPAATPHAIDGFFGIPPAANFGDITLDGSAPHDGGRSWATAISSLSPVAQPYFAGTVCLR